jgi:hypothetical protein
MTSLVEMATAGTPITIADSKLIAVGSVMTELPHRAAVSGAPRLASALVGLGIAEPDAEIYERVIREGSVLFSVAVHVDDAQKVMDLIVAHSGEYVGCFYYNPET